MRPSIKIATWNLARPKQNSWKRAPALLAKIREVDADIWILTETAAWMVPESGSGSRAPYVPLASQKCAFHAEGESCTTVWSRFGIRRAMPTWDPGVAVCAEIDSPLGPMLFYGTLITYAGDKGPAEKSRRWEEHRKAALRNAEDWSRLREEFPGHHLCVAGDFNQNRDGTRWYCDPEAEKSVSAGLRNAGLRCVTEHNLRKDRPEFGRANIDHICLSSGLAAKVEPSSYWMTGESDHNGVVAEVSRAA